MFTFVLQGITLGFTAGVTPGPLLAYFLSQSLQQGWKRTLPAAMAPLVSDGPIVALVLLVLTQIPEWLLTALQLLGGIFILYLAYKSARGLKDIRLQDHIAASGNTSLWDATLMNLLNPMPYIFWSTLLGPIFITGWRISPAHGIGFAAGFYGIMIACLMGFILLFDTARRLGSQVIRLLGGFSVVVMLFFGFFQIWTGVNALLPT